MIVPARSISTALVLVGALTLATPPGRAFDTIAYTASQSWNSRLYLLRPDGSEILHHDYSGYLLCDLEVIQNELYLVDWIAPALYQVDPVTGALDLVVTELPWSYLYDVAWDGTYVYLKEWSLHRYDLAGTSHGSTTFDLSLRGSAWDGSYYWTLDADGAIRCWDLSGWPTLVEIPANQFQPPSSLCRGLWYDGEYFWSAEAQESALGQIYRFDHSGVVVDQWTEPGFQGYSAGALTVGWPTPTPSPTPTSSPSPTVTPIPPTATPEPSPTGTSAPPTPTPTMEPSPRLGLELILDDRDLRAGDRFHLHHRLGNPLVEPILADIWILLDVHGSYWCYPSWISLDQGLDYRPDVPVAPGETRSEEVLDFSWPSLEGGESGLRFLGAAFRSGSLEMVGSLEVVVWAYGSTHR